MYTSNDLWEMDFKKVKELSAKLVNFKGTLGQAATNLLNCLNADVESSRLFEKVSVYANMRSDEDTTNTVPDGSQETIGVEVESRLGEERNEESQNQQEDEMTPMLCVGVQDHTTLRVVGLNYSMGEGGGALEEGGDKKWLFCF